MIIIIVTVVAAVVAGQSPHHKPTDYVPYQLLNDYKPIISAPIYKPTYPEYNPNAAYSDYKPTYNEPTYKPYHPVPATYQKPIHSQPSYKPYSSPKFPIHHSYSVKY